MWARRELYIFNGSKHVVRVGVDNSPTPNWCVDIGRCSVYESTMGTSMVTLSYYTEEHDLRSIFLRDNGSWTSSV